MLYNGSYGDALTFRSKHDKCSQFAILLFILL